MDPGRFRVTGFGGSALSILLGMEILSHKSHDEDGQHKTDDSRDQGGDPLGPTEHVTGFFSFKVQIKLLEDAFGLKQDYLGFMFQ